MSAPSERVRGLVELAASIVERARKKGATAAEVLARDGEELSISVREGKTEGLRYGGSRGVGLRVFVDHRPAFVYSSDLRDDALSELAERAVAMAKETTPDEHAGPADPGDIATSIPDLDLFDPELDALDPARAIEVLRIAEASALACDPRIDRVHVASWNHAKADVAFASTNGFAGGYSGTSASYSVSPVLDDAGGKKRIGQARSAARHFADLEDPREIGRRAAEKATRMIGARKIETTGAPVIFSPEAGADLLRELFNVVNGASFHRKTSYLIGREGQPVASPLVTVADDPSLLRAIGSRPFDGDGLPSRRNVVIDRGRLDTLLLDVYSARKLGRSSTGACGRTVGANPRPAYTNFILASGETAPSEIIRGVARGLYVTNLFGLRFDTVTGDFSRGAAGSWIEGGELAYPVAEVTVAATFDALWRNVDAVGDDPDRRGAVVSPTFRVASMKIAGR